MESELNRKLSVVILGDLTWPLTKKLCVTTTNKLCVELQPSRWLITIAGTLDAK